LWQFIFEEIWSRGYLLDYILHLQYNAWSYVVGLHLVAKYEIQISIYDELNIILHKPGKKSAYNSHKSSYHSVCFHLLYVCYLILEWVEAVINFYLSI